MFAELSFPSTRPRRTRQAPWIRKMVEETSLSVSDLIWPIFICEGENIYDPIVAMSGVFRLSLDSMIKEVEKIAKLGICCVALFPTTPASKKDPLGGEALNPDNLVCRAVRLLKKEVPSIGILCDVALDPYTSHGHDGLLNQKGIVDNDKTLEILIQQALLQAEAGCDILAPSDMMDGRIAAIRNALEFNGFTDMILMSYAAKYASAYYGPFRNAIGSEGNLKGDKKTYQMNPANKEEALKEVALDLKEGADLIMVKPGIPYLDIISAVKAQFQCPVFAYHVSGEYAMMQSAFERNLLDPEKTLLETMLCFKRAGTTGILTYFAPQIAQYLS
jgi:porphobilinogen synthase